MTQAFLTPLIALLTIAVPMTIFYLAIKTTPPHGFNCTKCSAEVPVNAVRCPKCGEAVVNADQPL